MTEVEANRILKFLMKRVERRSEIVSKGLSIALHSKYAFHSNPIVFKFKIDANARFITEHSIDGKAGMFVDTRASEDWVYIWEVKSENWKIDLGDKVIYLDSNKSKSKDIVECLFEKAKKMNISAGVEGHVPLIFKGESLEEVMVKADLEEIS